jgi:hypothetical protein
MPRNTQWKPQQKRCATCASRKWVQLDLVIVDGKVTAFRRGDLSFKYEAGRLGLAGEEVRPDQSHRRYDVPPGRCQPATLANRSAK